MGKGKDSFLAAKHSNSEQGMVGYSYIAFTNVMFTEYSVH